MAKVAKKVVSAPAPAPAPTATEETSAGRVKLSELPQEKRDEMCHALIDEIYGGELDQKEKSKRRQRLRNIDANWRSTYEQYILTNYPPPAEEESAPAPAPAPAPTKGKSAPTPAPAPSTAKKVAKKS